MTKTNKNIPQLWRNYPYFRKTKIVKQLGSPWFVVILDSKFPQIPKTSASGACTACPFFHICSFITYLPILSKSFQLGRGNGPHIRLLVLLTRLKNIEKINILFYIIQQPSIKKCCPFISLYNSCTFNLFLAIFTYFLERKKSLFHGNISLPSALYAYNGLKACIAAHTK